MTPDLTLAVPTRGDRSDYLSQCLSSIRNQDVSVRLILVTDDQPTAQRLTDEFPGTEIRVQPGQGAASAIDHVLSSADTPFCAWLGDDDLLVPVSLLESMGRLQKAKAATAVFGRCEVIDADGTVVGTVPTGRWAPAFSRFGRDLIPQPGSVFRTESYRAAGGLDTGLQYAFDLDLFLKLSQAGRLVFSPHVVARFRWHTDSLTASNPAPHAEAREVRRRYLARPIRTTEGLWFPVTDAVSRAIYAVNRRHDARRR